MAPFLTNKLFSFTGHFSFNFSFFHTFCKGQGKSHTFDIKSVLFASLFALSFFIVGCKEKKQPLNLPSYPVGYIPFSEELDDAKFQLCNDSVIVENGGRKSAYKGGVKGILKYFQPIIDSLAYQKKGEDGYLTVRFLMNCKGEKDRFRTLAISRKYKPKEFSEKLSLPVIEAVKKMDGWQVAMFNGQPYDSYNMLTFKIKDGQIVDIIP